MLVFWLSVLLHDFYVIVTNSEVIKWQFINIASPVLSSPHSYFLIFLF